MSLNFYKSKIFITLAVCLGSLGISQSNVYAQQNVDLSGLTAGDNRRIEGGDVLAPEVDRNPDAPAGQDLLAPGADMISERPYLDDPYVPADEDAFLQKADVKTEITASGYQDKRWQADNADGVYLNNREAVQPNDLK